MLVRPAMKRLFCLKAKNGLGRFAPSALPHYYKWNIAQARPMSASSYVSRSFHIEFRPPIGRTHSRSFSAFL